MTEPISARSGADAQRATHFDDGTLAAGLARLGYEAFRPGQREAIETLLREDRLLLVAPTGGGKSLTYQLPGTLLPGTTVVISPLISLMADQVAALEARGIAATFLASTLESDELRLRMNAVERGDYALVYVAPERLSSEGFRSMMSKVRCPLIAIDEAHCISEWGHDFRPDYLQIGRLLAGFPGARVLACTATATPVVRDEIIADAERYGDARRSRLVVRSAAQAIAEQRRMAAAEDEDALAKLATAGSKIVRLSDAERERFIRAVAPVVMTSSIISTCRYGRSPRTANAARRFLARSLACSPDCDGVARFRVTLSTSGTRSFLASGIASSRAWLKPRKNLRRQCNGTGNTASISSGSPAAASHNSCASAGP